MAVSLAGPRRTLEAMMTDSCTITTTSATPVDDAIDPNTLKPVPVPGETPSTLYAGRCFWTSQFGGEDLKAPGNAPIELGDGWLFLPSTAPVPPPGAKVTITASLNDAALVDLEAVVVSDDQSTLNIARAVRCRTFTPGRPIHGD